MWWEDLPASAKACYNNGHTELTPSAIPWEAFRRWQDLEHRVYRPFNPDTMHWNDYRETSDYLVWVHHEHKRLFEILDGTERARQKLVLDGLALAPTMDVIEPARQRYCEGCEYNHPSQRRHQCMWSSDDENE